MRRITNNLGHTAVSRGWRCYPCVQKRKFIPRRNAFEAPLNTQQNEHWMRKKQTRDVAFFTRPAL